MNHSGKRPRSVAQIQLHQHTRSGYLMIIPCEIFVPLRVTPYLSTSFKLRYLKQQPFVFQLSMSRILFLMKGFRFYIPVLIHVKEALIFKASIIRISIECVKNLISHKRSWLLHVVHILTRTSIFVCRWQLSWYQFARSCSFICSSVFSLFVDKSLWYLLVCFCRF